MALPELSSNWKNLQARIQAESTTAKATAPQEKRKRVDASRERPNGAPSKRPKIDKKEASSGSSSSTSSSTSRRTKTKELNQSAKSRSSSSSSSSSSFSSPYGKPPHMGAAQSVPVPHGSELTVTPSLALWAEDNGISAEDLAEAYGLGARADRKAMAEAAAAARPNEGLAPGVEVGKYVAIDCEMVGVGPGGYESALARVSVVDFHGRQVYDSFVRPRERVTDWRTAVSGVSRRHMAAARSFEEVQAQVGALLRGRILVGHDLRHDLQMLMLDHPAKLTRDTARFSGFRKYGHGPKPALRVLAREILGLEIQTGQHSSIEDARVAMLLFRRHKQAFDVEHARRFPDAASSASSSASRPKAPTQTKKAKAKKRKKH